MSSPSHVCAARRLRRPREVDGGFRVGVRGAGRGEGDGVGGRQGMRVLRVRYLQSIRSKCWYAPTSPLSTNWGHQDTLCKNIRIR